MPYKYYFDSPCGKAIEVFGNIPMANADFKASHPGLKALKYDGYHIRTGRCANGDIYPITRAIEFKKNPSLHECNARCLHGKATGSCECQCGGKNHGRGLFTSLHA
jgi:hypothetical protein